MGLRRSDEAPAYGWIGSVLERTREFLTRQLRRQGIDLRAENSVAEVPQSARFEQERSKSSENEPEFSLAEPLSGTRLQCPDPLHDGHVRPPLEDGAACDSESGWLRVSQRSGQRSAPGGGESSDPLCRAGRDEAATLAQPRESRPQRPPECRTSAADSFAQSCPGSKCRKAASEALSAQRHFAFDPPPPDPTLYSQGAAGTVRQCSPRLPHEVGSRGANRATASDFRSDGQYCDATVIGPLADLGAKNVRGDHPPPTSSECLPERSPDEIFPRGAAGSVGQRQLAKFPVPADGSGRAKPSTSSQSDGCRGASEGGAAPPGTLLDTRGITRHAPRNPKDLKALDIGSRREAWHRELRKLTLPHRTRRAQAFRAAAQKRRQKAREEAAFQAVILRAHDCPNAEGHFEFTREERTNVGKWHLDRAKGQEFRFENVASCGSTGQVVASCQECGQVLEPHPITCGTSLLCVECRGRLAAKRRARLTRARDALAQAAHRAGLTRRGRPGSAWQESLITLTLPQRARDGVADRIQFVRAAWPHFIRTLRRHAHVDPKDVALMHWYMAHEWTLGADDRGHPHIHLYFYGPRFEHSTRYRVVVGDEAAAIAARFSVSLQALKDAHEKPEQLCLWKPKRNVPKRDWANLREGQILKLPGAAYDLGPRHGADGTTIPGLIDFWRSALEKACFGDPVLPENALPSAEVTWQHAGPLVVDVRVVKPGPKSTNEVIKYIVKDVDDGELIDPSIYAEVYCAIDGKRTHQGSRGFLKMGDRPFRCDCGTDKPFFVRVCTCGVKRAIPSELGLEPGFT